MYEDVAIEQGLGPMMDALDEVAIEWDLWQSGGNCMVLTVWSLDESGEWGITWDDDVWVLAWYEGGTQADREDDEPYWYMQTTGDVVDAIAAKNEAN